ncbi:MAG TPA: HEAT repeat domain-containing protein, partial [Polyangiaceae bacterium]
MPTLSSSIVKHQLASVRDVEEALARQAMYGGDLATNLLELAGVSEERLAELLAESHEVSGAPTGELPVSDADVRRLVPRELARRFGLYPLESRGDTLVVAVSEPLPAEVESDLGFSLGMRVEQRIAMSVRIQQALARDYQMPLEQRAERILAKLAGRPDPNPSVFPAAPETPPVITEKLPPPLAPKAPAVAREAIDLSSLTRREPKPRRLGPYTMAMAERDLLDAADTDDVLRAFFDFASQYFEYTAMFAVHGDLAEGRDATGSGAPRARVLSLGIPLDLPSALSRALATDRFSLLRLGTGGLDGALARDLDRRPGPQVLLLPIRVVRRPVLVLYGDHGNVDVQLETVGQVISFAPLVSSALEHLIRKRKQSTNSLPPPRLPVRPPKSAQVRPRPEERAAALASALGVDESFEPPASPQPPSLRSSALARPVIAVGSPARSITPAQGSPTTHDAPESSSPHTPPLPPPTPPSGESVPPPSERGFQPREHATEPGMGAQSRKLELVAQPHEGSLPPPADEAVGPHEANFSPNAPEISLGAESLDEDWDQYAPDSGGVPLAPSSRSLAHSARPLPIGKSSAELKLPTVIVDLAHDCQLLLDQLLAGSSAAGDRLVQIGEPAVAVLASSFPGPITAELRRGVSNAPSRASECGPVLRTLSRIGVRAAPVLVVRTGDADPNVRAWATRLLGEMPNEESARAIVRRFVDEEQEVRRAALAAGRLMQPDLEARSMIQTGLAELHTDP